MIENLRIPSNYLVNKARVNKSTLLSPHELKAMLHAAERIRDKTLLVLLYETAARPQEVRNLRWGDVNWDQQEIHLYSKKCKEDRDLPLRESLRHLKRWKEEWVLSDPTDKDYIFPSLIGSRVDRTRPVSVSYINRIIKNLAQKVGIQRRVSTYLLRHTRLTEVRKCGLQGLEFNQFAGHHPASRQESVYVHLDNDDMKQSVLEKVYKIREEENATRSYEQRIASLETQLKEVLRYLRKSKETLACAQESVAKLDVSGQST